MEEKDIIDYGSITVPTKWDDVTLDMFSEIERYYQDKDKDFDVREVLHIMIGKDIDFINSLPAEFLDIIMQKLSFLQTQPEIGEATNKIVIDGETYQVNVFEKLRTGEYVSFDMALKADKHDYSTFMAILCRKDGEKYDSHYEAEVFDSRKKMFGKQPVTKIMPIVNFFLHLWFVQGSYSQLYSKVEEAISLTQHNIENSDKIGVFKRYYLNWQMRKLKKSLKSSNSTSRTRSRSLRTLLRKAKWKRSKTNGKKLEGKQ
jgi:hypothetical protein